MQGHHQSLDISGDHLQAIRKYILPCIHYRLVEVLIFWVAMFNWQKQKEHSKGVMAVTGQRLKISSFLLLFFFPFLFCNHGKTIEVNFPWTFLFKGLGPHWPSRASWNLILSTRGLLKQSGSTTTIYVP